MLKVTCDPKANERIKQATDLLMLPAAKRRKILHAMGKEYIKQGRINAKKQSSPSGQKWPKRKGRSRKKMLRGLARTMGVSKLANSYVEVSWKNKRTAKVAAAHHLGHAETHTRAQAIRALQREGK